MSTTPVNIIARTPFDKIEPGNKVVKMVRITYQLADTRIGTVEIPATDEKTPKEDTAIAASIKNLPASPFERKDIKVG